MKTKFFFLFLCFSLIISAISLMGCDGDSSGSSDKDGITTGDPVETTWEYDFMTDGDQDVLDTDWYFSIDGSNPRAYETDYGYYMNMTSIAAPYLFTGDFTVSFEFYLKVLTDENIYRYAFRLVDPNWENASQKYFSLTAYYTAFPIEHEDAYYQTSQGDGSYTYNEYDGNVPGTTNGVNTCTIEKEGNDISVYMNDTHVRSVTIAASNEPYTGYAPLIHGHNSWDQADSNFYLRKVTVTYMSDERIYHDWNP